MSEGGGGAVGPSHRAPQLVTVDVVEGITAGAVATAGEAHDAAVAATAAAGAAQATAGVAQATAMAAAAKFQAVPEANIVIANVDPDVEDEDFGVELAATGSGGTKASAAGIGDYDAGDPSTYVEWTQAIPAGASSVVAFTSCAPKGVELAATSDGVSATLSGNYQSSDSSTYREWAQAIPADATTIVVFMWATSSTPSIVSTSDSRVTFSQIAKMQDAVGTIGVALVANVDNLGISSLTLRAGTSSQFNGGRQVDAWSMVSSGGDATNYSVVKATENDGGSIVANQDSLVVGSACWNNSGIANKTVAQASGNTTGVETQRAAAIQNISTLAMSMEVGESQAVVMNTDLSPRPFPDLTQAAIIVNLRPAPTVPVITTDTPQVTLEQIGHVTGSASQAPHGFAFSAYVGNKTLTSLTLRAGFTGSKRTMIDAWSAVSGGTASGDYDVTVIDNGDAESIAAEKNSLVVGYSMAYRPTTADLTISQDSGNTAGVETQRTMSNLTDNTVKLSTLAMTKNVDDAETVVMNSLPEADSQTTRMGLIVQLKSVEPPDFDTLGSFARISMDHPGGYTYTQAGGSFNAFTAFNVTDRISPDLTADPDTASFTVNYIGTYQVDVGAPTNETHDITLAVAVNGTIVAARRCTGYDLSLYPLVYAKQGDVISLLAKNNSSGNITFDSSSHMSISLVNRSYL